MKITLKLLFISTLIAGCAPSTSTTVADKTASTQKSLYERLGGKDAITAVVNEFVTRVAADSVINARFANTDIPHFKAMLVEQISAATGGPVKYTGKDMKTSHAGMKISDTEFGALVGDLKGALDQFKVGAVEQDQLIGALAGMKGDIVGQ
jgi:hemoglobin